jgi:hypothetical protein
MSVVTGAPFFEIAAMSRGRLGSCFRESHSRGNRFRASHSRGNRSDGKRSCFYFFRYWRRNCVAGFRGALRMKKNNALADWIPDTEGA